MKWKNQENSEVTACTQWDHSMWSQERIGHRYRAHLSPWTCLFIDNQVDNSMCIMFSFMWSKSPGLEKVFFFFKWSDLRISKCWQGTASLQSLPAGQQQWCWCHCLCGQGLGCPSLWHNGTLSAFDAAISKPFKDLQRKKYESGWHLETLTPGNAKEAQASKLEDGYEWPGRTSQRQWWSILLSNAVLRAQGKLLFKKPWSQRFKSDSEFGL